MEYGKGNRGGGGREGGESVYESFNEFGMISEGRGGGWENRRRGECKGGYRGREEGGWVLLLSCRLSWGGTGWGGGL